MSVPPAVAESARPYRESAAAVAERLRTDPEHGLTQLEAGNRLRTVGPNRLPEPPRRGPFRLFLAQFADLMVIVLLIAAVVAGMIGEPQDTIVILAIVVLNAVLGFVQAYRAERALAALRGLAAPSARVLRDGHPRMVPADQLVPGDVVLLEEGNLVPADLRLVRSAGLRVDESALTGESVPVEKVLRELDEPDLPLTDRLNLAYRGTTVTFGRAAGIVVATGARTELGLIASLLEEGEQPLTPLQKRLSYFGKWLALAAVSIGGLVVVLGTLRGEPLVAMLLTGVSLAVAAIPEALPAVVTVALALGARQLARQRALVRHLPAVETLGSVTCICADKTGTITHNRMRVRRWWVDGRELEAPPPPAGRDGSWPALLRALALNNNCRPDAEGELTGDPTDVALRQAAEDAGLDPAELTRYPRVAEIPHSAERGVMTTLHGGDARILVIVKGAPEWVLAHAGWTEGAGGLDPQAAEQAAARFAAQGLRVIAVAWRFAPREAAATPEKVEDALTFLGLVGLSDPPRPEVKEAVALCLSAGITPVLITGDHPETARAIAREVGILDGRVEVMTGRELAGLSRTELVERVGRVRVFARVVPAQKLAIVEALRARGELVAMTGDGVNDAPALQSADIGIAMGRHGTDVAREASDLILLDDNFATIVAAVRGGRRVYDNIRKFIRFITTGNAGEIWVILLAPLLGLPVPLLPIHILWVNLVSDGLPGLALAVEPEEPDVMRRGPRPPGESVFARGLWQHVVWVGILIGAVSLAAGALSWTGGSTHWRSMTFTTLAASQLFHVLAISSERRSFFSRSLRTNPALLVVVLATLALQVAVLYAPPARALLRTEALTLAELVLCLGLALAVFGAVEVEKWVNRKSDLRRESAGAHR